MWARRLTAVVAKRAPLAPSEWPRAIAPPQAFTLTLSSGRPQFTPSYPKALEQEAPFGSQHDSIQPPLYGAVNELVHHITQTWTELPSVRPDSVNLYALAGKRRQNDL